VTRARDLARVVVLADTHLRTAPADGRRVSRALPDVVCRALPGAHAILHAGDVLDAGVLELLRGYAPVFAVLGNNDVTLVRQLPPTLVIELAGVRIGMIHDSGAATGRAARMRRRFPDSDVVVFGHSHAPLVAEGAGGQLLFNPGSPTQRRAQPRCTFGELRLQDGAVVDRRIIPIPAPA
jgi:putative phosphoesterase